MAKNDQSVRNAYGQNLHRVITCYRVDSRNVSGLNPVMLEINLQNTRVRINTGVKITKEQWDPDNLVIKKSVEKSADLNLIIRNSKARITDIFVRYRLQLKDLTPEILLAEYHRPSVNIDFLEFMDAAIKERKGSLADSSLAQHQAHLNKLKEFRPHLTFSELTEELFLEYHRWLKNTKDNGQNTRWNSIKTIRTYINIAKRRKLIEENPLDRMPVKQGQGDPAFLDEDELQRLVALYRKKWLPDNYQRALRYYLFCCFTSIRISDLNRIRMEDIISNILVMMPYKTMNVNATTVRIPLVKMAIQLIKDESPYRIKGLCFSPYSEPRSRLFMKDIFAHAKIHRKLTFHSSRHTFATNFLKKTNNLVALQKILGHRNIQTTMIYAHLLTSDIVREMGAMDQF
jgi:integrase